MNGPLKLDHIGVFVSDLERAREFYEATLGMQLVERDEDDSHHMMTLRAGDQEIHLFQPKSSRAAHLNHVSYRIDAARFDDFVRGLESRGVAYSGPHRYRNTKFVKFKDPDGLIWECLCVEGGV